MQGHRLPEPLYFYEGKFGAELVNFDQLIQDPSLEKSIQDNFDEDCEEAEKQVRLIFKPILKSDRKAIIKDIVECLKTTSLNKKA